MRASTWPYVLDAVEDRSFGVEVLSVSAQCDMVIGGSCGFVRFVTVPRERKHEKLISLPLRKRVAQA